MWKNDEQTSESSEQGNVLGLITPWTQKITESFIVLLCALFAFSSWSKSKKKEKGKAKKEKRNVCVTVQKFSFDVFLLPSGILTELKWAREEDDDETHQTTSSLKQSRPCHSFLSITGWS